MDGDSRIESLRHPRSKNFIIPKHNRKVTHADTGWKGRKLTPLGFSPLVMGQWSWDPSQSDRPKSGGPWNVPHTSWARSGRSRNLPCSPGVMKTTWHLNSPKWTCHDMSIRFPFPLDCPEHITPWAAGSSSRVFLQDCYSDLQFSSCWISIPPWLRGHVRWCSISATVFVFCFFSHIFGVIQNEQNASKRDIHPPALWVFLFTSVHIQIPRRPFDPH